MELDVGPKAKFRPVLGSIPKALATTLRFTKSNEFVSTLLVIHYSGGNLV